MCTRKQILDSRPRSEWERLIDEWIYDELDRSTEPLNACLTMQRMRDICPWE